MALVLVAFVAGALTVVFAALNLARMAMGKTAFLSGGKCLPWWVQVTMLLVGLMFVLSSAPGLFFDNPHWLDEKLFWAVEYILKLFT